MITQLKWRGALVVSVLAGLFFLQMSAAVHAIDPGLGVGRPGPGVGVPGVGAPGVGVAPIYALPRGCVKVIVNGIVHWRCGVVVYRPVVQNGRTVYVIVR